MTRDRLGSLVTLLALIFVLTGATLWVVRISSGGQIEVLEQSEVPITVELSGFVSVPGTYQMFEGERISDLILEGGGVSVCGDINGVANTRFLNDGDMVHVPELIINLNSATNTVLESLPGIGPTLAQRIVETRPFSDVESLLSVDGIGEATLDTIKGYSCKLEV